jgi:TRAP-type mannitol/chloroaromatic compound transport system permease small subunit
MAKKIQTFLNIVGQANRKIGNGVSFLLLLIMVLIGIATISRYFFNSPITIVWPFIKQIFGVFILIGVSYTLLNKKHIRVEILYDAFPAWMKKVTWLTSLICFLSFIGVLVWQGIVMANISLMLKEVSPHSANIPVYPFKILLPICAFLFLLQGLNYFFYKE